MTIHIEFRRDAQFTYGGDNCAWCEVDNKVFSVPPVRRGKRKGQAEGVAASGHAAPVYRVLVALSDAGYDGHPFIAYDGYMPCLCGVVDKKAIPTEYGGEKQME